MVKTNYTRGLTYYRPKDVESECYYTSPIGSFALAKKHQNGFQRKGYWLDCREDFDRAWRQSKSTIFFFKDDDEQNKRRHGKSARVAAFINEVETRLKVRPRTQFFAFKNTRNVTGIQFSNWWKENHARRQLFTILLRCGINFTGKNFQNALFSDEEEYMKGTREAVERFFEGYTHCRRRLCDWNGWFNFFENGRNLNHLQKFSTKK